MVGGSNPGLGEMRPDALECGGMTPLSIGATCRPDEKLGNIRALQALRRRYGVLSAKPTPTRKNLGFSKPRWVGMKSG